MTTCGVRASCSLRDDHIESLGNVMTHEKGHVEENLEAAKNDVKNAASAVVEEAKEKVHGVVESVQGKVVEAVDKAHTAAHKDDFKK